MNDNEIISQIQAGDTSNYELLERKFHPFFHHLINVYHLGYDRDEYFQIARIEFYECILSFDPARQTKLITYAWYSIRKAFQKNASQNDMEVEIDYERHSEEKSDFEYMISDLSEDDQSLLRDYFFYGLSQEELAVKHRMSQKSISLEISRIIEKLRRKFY